MICCRAFAAFVMFMRLACMTFLIGLHFSFPEVQLMSGFAYPNQLRPSTIPSGMSAHKYLMVNVRVPLSASILIRCHVACVMGFPFDPSMYSMSTCVFSRFIFMRCRSASAVPTSSLSQALSTNCEWLLSSVVLVDAYTG